jgi:hypothetical protein
MEHNIEQGAGGIDVLLKFKGFVASVPRLLKLIVAQQVPLVLRIVFVRIRPLEALRKISIVFGIFYLARKKSQRLRML